MRFRLTVDGEDHQVEVERRRDGLRVRVDGAPYRARVSPDEGEFNVRIGPRVHRVAVRGSSVVVDGTPYEVLAELEESGGTGPAGTTSAGPATWEVRPPMPGRIVKLPIAPGDRVKRGQPLAVLEAMKMQNEIPAPADAVVVEVRATEGETIGPDRVIAVLESRPSKAP